MRRLLEVTLTDEQELTLRVLSLASGRSEADVLRAFLSAALERASADEVVEDALSKLTHFGRRPSTGSHGTLNGVRNGHR